MNLMNQTYFSRF